MTMFLTELAVTTQSWTVDRWAAISDRLLPADSDDDGTIDDTRLTAWVVLVGVLVLAAAGAWAICIKNGYRGFTGEMKLHTKWKVPIGIKLECY